MTKSTFQLGIFEQFFTTDSIVGKSQTDILERSEFPNFVFTKLDYKSL